MREPSIIGSETSAFGRIVDKEAVYAAKVKNVHKNLVHGNRVEMSEPKNLIE